MTQPPGGYPPPDPGHRPPVDPFRAPPPDWPAGPREPSRSGQPAQPARPYGPPAQPYGQPTQAYGQPTQAYGEPPPFGEPGPPGGSGPPYQPPGGAAPGGAPGPPPRRRRRGLLILALGLAGVLVLCAGGGVAAWLLTRDPDRDGAETPTVAVQSFLQAVYRDLDPAAAASLVCSEARDEDSLSTKIDEIRAYEETEVDPTFSWTDPTVVDETDELAVLSVTITMTTEHEKTSEQTLHVSVLDKEPHGWWVCDLETVPEDPADEGEPGDEGGPGEEGESGDDESGEDQSGG